MNWNTNEKKNLVKAILLLNNTNEAESFLRDLLTKTEIEEFSRRLETASMLSRGIHYSAIEEKTGFSSTTIARVSKWLKNGMGGYKKIIHRLHTVNPKLARRGLS